MTDLIFRYWKTSVLAIVAMTVFCLLGILKIEPSFFRAIPLPESDPAVQANAALGDHFGGFESVTFVVESPDILSKPAVDTIQALTEDAKGLSGVRSPQAVASLATTFETRSDSSGFSFHPILDGELGSALDARLKAHPFVDGLLVNRQRNAALVVANIGERAYPDSSIASEEFQLAHYNEVKGLIGKYTKDRVKVTATGSELVFYVTQNFVKKEIVSIGLLAIAFLVLVLYVSFKSWRLTGLACSIMILTVLWTFGIMGWAGIPLGQCSIYVIIVILAVGSSYAIHVIATIGNRAAHVKSKRIAIRMALSDVSLPLLTVSLAAALSGISLLTFDIPDIRELGILQALGITLSYVLSYFLLPVLMLRYGSNALRDREIMRLEGSRRHLWVDATIDRALDALMWLPLRRPRLSALLTALLVSVSLLGITRVVPSFILEEGVPRDSLPRQGYERLTETFGAFRLTNVIVEKTNETPGKILDPAGLKTVSRIQADLEAMPDVRVLPSIADVFTQLNGVLQNKAEIPATQDLIDQSLLLVGKKRLSRLVDRTGRRALLTLSLDSKDPRRMSELIHQIQDKLKHAPPGYFAQLSGTPVLVDSINHYIVENKIISIISCLVIVLALCMIVNSSLKLGFISVAAAAVAALAVFGLMGFLGIHLDLSSSTITTIAIGVGVDSAVHYLLQFRADLSEYASRRDEKDEISLRTYKDATRFTTHRYGKTIVFDSLSNILGFFPLLVSSFPILRIAGGLLVVNQILVVAASFFVTPMLILILRPDLPKSRAGDPKAYELADELQ
jgi:predicted RND superfamily exporter protein